MAGDRCQHCGCTEIDTDPARGDAVCTNCGSVLQDSIMVSEVQFEENGRGGASALGQFVSSESKGGGSLRGNFHSGLSKESREITLKNAKQRITALCHQLRLNQHCIDTSYNYFKLALSRHLTRGRKSALIVGACVYITCRTEGTPHMLLDFSDTLQVDVFELGRTYLRLSQALCINIPILDPCVHILRFANEMGFSKNKLQEVSNTASRLVMRFKKDWMHIGRRPAGICGAALVIAGRLHGFSCSLTDAVKIVRVHESTIRKRLSEFGETPSSALTLEEFMNVDLEEEQDPPAFRTARRKDRERIQKIIEEQDVDGELLELKKNIEEELQKHRKKVKGVLAKCCAENEANENNKERIEAEQFMVDSTMSSIWECVNERNNNVNDNTGLVLPPHSPVGLGPSPASLGLTRSSSSVPQVETIPEEENGDGILELEGIDDDEINSYLMSDKEIERKTNLWNKLNEDYVKEQKEKAEKLAKEKQEGKPEKKKRKSTQKKQKNFQANSAGEAIEKMLQEKKISNKINYEVLRSLTANQTSANSEISNLMEVSPKTTNVDEPLSPSTIPGKRKFQSEANAAQDEPKAKLLRPGHASKAPSPDKTVASKAPSPDKTVASKEESATAVASKDDEAREVVVESGPVQYEHDLEAEYDEGDEYEEDDGHHMSAAQLLSQHRGEDDYEGFEDYDY